MTPPATRLPGSVLFACNQNIIRSPMAEAIMKHLHGQAVFADSCGVHAGYSDPFIRQVLAEKGLSDAPHTPKSFDDIAVNSFDMIISLTPEAHRHALAITRTSAVAVELWDTPDPSRATGSRERLLEAYRGVRDHLINRIRERFPPPSEDSPAGKG